MASSSLKAQSDFSLSREQARKLAVALLASDGGISEQDYKEALFPILEHFDFQDILVNVGDWKNRFYLPTGWKPEE